MHHSPTIRASPFVRRLALLLWALWSAAILQAQQIELSPDARLSVLTCGPGADLYATFGHTAFRIQDPVQGIDWVYNYGTFDFNTPNFYLKFARGKLQYALSRQVFTDFLYTYQLENRWVREQWLALDVVQRQGVFDFLQQNHRPENRFYPYDFLEENCATKIPEVLKKVLGPQLIYRENHLEATHSFRDLIQNYLRTNSWSSVGIDLALGAVVDREAAAEDYLFLPDYVRLQLNNSSLNGEPLVSRDRSILDLEPTQSQTYFTATPLFWMLILLILVASITWIDYHNGSRSRLLDFLLFALSGASGLVIAFLWFFTEHSSTVWNTNILWALPINAIAAFILIRRDPIHPLLPPYLYLALGALLLCPVLWLLGVQHFSPLLPVIWLALSVRYLFLIHHAKRHL